MTVNRLGQAVRCLRRAVLSGGPAEPADGDLLDRFIARRDEAAFADLMRRHGPMVLGVCRRVLGNHHDAEDAAQAVFLVLVRKATSVTPRGTVGNWLYGVAYRTALEAQAAAARRRRKESQVGKPAGQTAEADGRDLAALLDQELHRLPDKYRTAVVLCELEGKSRREAARQLRVPEGTLSSRLATARRLLARRLARRGLAVTGGALAAALSKEASAAAIPAPLVASTAKAAAAGGATAAAGVSGQVIALTEGVLKAMLFNKLRSALYLTLLAAVAALAALALPRPAGADPAAAPPAAKAPPEAAAKPQETKTSLQGGWKMVAYDAAGLQLTPEALKKRDARITFGADGRVNIRATAPDRSELKAQGTYRLDPDADPPTIDLTVRPPFQKEEFQAHGIYRIDGDMLKVVSSLPGVKQRPTGFDADGAAVVRVTARRTPATDGAPPETRKDDAAAEPPPRDDAGPPADRAALAEENARLRRLLRQKEDEVLDLRREVEQLRDAAGRPSRKPAGDGDRLSQLLDAELNSGRADEQVVETLYLAVLSRRPTAGEDKFAAVIVAGLKDRRLAFGQLLWMLTNSKEFVEVEVDKLSSPAVRQAVEAALNKK
jgi:RNA polymerase sigma-70 factor (ECF subfamily)